VGKKLAAEVVIPNDGTVKNLTGSPFVVARAVSLIRIRVDQDPAEAVANANVDFTDAMFAVRRATTTYSLNGTYTYATADGTTGLASIPGTFAPATPETTNVFFSNKAVKTANPAAADYTNPNTIMVASDGIDLWNDYLIWAGGSTTDAAKKFDIVIGGVTKAGYVPVGETTAVAAGTPVYWTGAVNGLMGPNQILELILTLKTAGSVTPPEVGEYGGLEITADLVDWGDIIDVSMDL
jgi:hypothetical protein